MQASDLVKPRNKKKETPKPSTHNAVKQAPQQPQQVSIAQQQQQQQQQQAQPMVMPVTGGLLMPGQPPNGPMPGMLHPVSTKLKVMLRTAFVKVALLTSCFEYSLKRNLIVDL